MIKKPAWSHLPNASRIDQVLAHAKVNPKEWVAAWDAAWVAASDAAWVAAWDAAELREGGAARRAAILALVAWDHSGSLLDLLPDQVLMLSKLGKPAAIVMYPAVLAMSDKG